MHGQVWSLQELIPGWNAGEGEALPTSSECMKTILEGNYREP